MEFSKFAEQLDKLESMSSRNEMVVSLAAFLKELGPHEIPITLYMMNGRIVPEYIPLEFNFSTKLLLKSIENGFKVSRKDLGERMRKTGDIGSVAQSIIAELPAKKVSKLDIQQVYDSLFELANAQGKGSSQTKALIFIDLAKKLDALSVRFVSRIITGKLRLGMSTKTILDALSWAMKGDKSMKDELERAFGVRSDLGFIARMALDDDVAKLEKLKIMPGVPVASKLVEREKSIEAAFKRMGECIVQPKYDGLRTQIHFASKGFEDISSGNSKSREKHFGLNFEMFSKKNNEKETVRIFSRNMEPLSEMFPDIVKVISHFKLKSVVLDAETIGYDSKADKFIPFQETIKRKRKFGISLKAKEIPIKVFVFDVLHLDGVDLTSHPLEERLALLKGLFRKIDTGGLLEFSDSKLVKSVQELSNVFEDALGHGLEGVIVKDKMSKYMPGTRTYDWIKLKANISSELVDTIDCVVLGFYHGRGQRARFGAGAFLVGVYNKARDRFESVAKVGSGIKDEAWPGLVKQINNLKVEKLPSNVIVKKELIPDVICKPEIVVVIEADEVTKSKAHSAGVVKEGDKGLSLRFPRLKEWDRKDKSPEDITTVEELRKMS